MGKASEVVLKIKEGSHKSIELIMDLIDLQKNPDDAAFKIINDLEPESVTDDDPFELISPILARAAESNLKKIIKQLQKGKQK
jgi:hypothetical protein